MSPLDILDGYDHGEIVYLQCAKELPKMWAIRPSENSDVCPLFETEQEAIAAYEAACR